VSLKYGQGHRVKVTESSPTGLGKYYILMIASEKMNWKWHRSKIEYSQKASVFSNGLLAEVTSWPLSSESHCVHVQELVGEELNRYEMFIIYLCHAHQS